MDGANGLDGAISMKSAHLSTFIKLFFLRVIGMTFFRKSWAPLQLFQTSIVKIFIQILQNVPYQPIHKLNTPTMGEEAV